MSAPKGTPPGRPLTSVDIRWVKVSENTYVNIDTARLTNRHGYDNIVAQKYGFRNAYDYQQFSHKLGGIGGLTGLNANDIKRARIFAWNWEKKHNMAPGTFYDQHPLFAVRVRNWLNEPKGRTKDIMLTRILDQMGIRNHNPQYLVGETP